MSAALSENINEVFAFLIQNLEVVIHSFPQYTGWVGIINFELKVLDCIKFMIVGVD